MTEGQWLWILIHQSIDNDEQIEKMCKDCKDELSIEKCNTCGKKQQDINPNFDEEFFKRLKKSSI